MACQRSSCTASSRLISPVNLVIHSSRTIGYLQVCHYRVILPYIETSTCPAPSDASDDQIAGIAGANIDRSGLRAPRLGRSRRSRRVTAQTRHFGKERTVLEDIIGCRYSYMTSRRVQSLLGGRGIQGIRGRRHATMGGLDDKMRTEMIVRERSSKNGQVVEIRSRLGTSDYAAGGVNPA